MLRKAKKLAKHTEELAATRHWGVDDQDTLEWLIAQVEAKNKPLNQAITTESQMSKCIKTKKQD